MAALVHLLLWTLWGGGFAQAAVDAHDDPASVSAGAEEVLKPPTAAQGPTPPAAQNLGDTPAAAPVEPTPVALVQGRVLAMGTREPLWGVLLTTADGFSTETDEEGAFLWELPLGTHQWVVQHPEFESLHTTITVGADTPPLTLRLRPRAGADPYRTVVVGRPKTEPQISLRGEELRRTPGSFGDPLRTIESLPGVAQVMWPLALYAVRGGNPGNTGFFIDGLRVPALFHFALGPSVVHPYFLSGLDFYPGGYPVQYGRYVAGAIVAHTAPGPTDRWRGSVDVRLFDAGALVSIPFNEGKGVVTAAGRYSYTGALLSALSPGQELFYADYQLRLDHPLGAGRLTVFALGSADRIGNQIQTSARAALEFHRLDMRWRGPALGGTLHLAMAGGADQATTDLSRVPITVRSYSLVPRTRFERPLAPWLSWELGTDGEFQRFRPQAPATEGDLGDLAQERDALSLGAYTGFTLRLGDRLALSPGLRADAFFEQGVYEVEPQPRLALRLKPLGALDLWVKGSVGRFVQMASLPVAVPGFESFSLRTLGLQRSWQGSLGLEAALGQALTVDVTGFAQRYFGLTDLACINCFNPEDPPDFRRETFFDKREGLGYGVEFLIRRSSQERFYGWLSYTLSWSLRADDGQVLYSDWDQRHILNVLGGYRFENGYGFSARFHYNTGRPYPIYAESVAEYLRLPHFYQLDLRLDRRYIFDLFVLDVYLELVNTTLTPQVVELVYRRDPQGGSHIERQSFRIVLPSVGVRGEF